MASITEVINFVESIAADQGLARKLVFVEDTSEGLRTYRALPTTTSKPDISAALKDWHAGGAAFPAYIATFGARNKVLSVREIRLSAWMEKQYEKQNEEE